MRYDSHGLQQIFFVNTPNATLSDVSFMTAPFTPDLWSALAAVSVVIAIVHWLCYVVLSVGLQTKTRRNNGLATSLWDLLELLLNQV